MAFIFAHFQGTSSGAASAPKLWTYNSSTDSVATIGADGYFDELFLTLNQGDLLYIVASDGVQQRVVTSEIYVKPVVTGGFVVSGLVNTADIANNAVTAAKLANYVPRTTSVTVSAAEFIAMAATPKLIIAAPGANQLIRVMDVRYEFDFNSVQYTGGGVVALEYDAVAAGAGTLASATIANTVFNGFAADSTIGAAGASATSLSSATVNKGIYLSTPTTFAAGNSVVHVHVTYETVVTTV
jgi:hypothetical protein